MNADTIVTKAEQHIETVVDGEVVLMHVETGRFFSLSGTGRRAWELLEGPTAVGALVGRLVDEFDVDRGTCTADVVELCERLAAGGLVNATA